MQLFYLGQLQSHGAAKHYFLKKIIAGVNACDPCAFKDLSERSLYDLVLHR